MLALVAEEIEKFAHDHTDPEAELFRRLRDETYAQMDCPQMQVGRLEGRFLKMLVRLTRARLVLEIGMFTGYSALMMAEGLPDDGRLITCDVDPKAEAIARRYFAESPNGHKIEIRMGPALETVASLSGLSGQIDMVFIDADKGNYSNYYEASVPLLRAGGLIVADNVLWSGRVLNPQDADSRAIVEFDKRVQADPRVENVCLTVRDGMTLAWKIPAAT
ncbi:MAG TPA: class I SAM-dependent methyltransferase [Blastocatellia bacterium]|nr:class I SAM-dependent methyltransferase [Blastocatellia bacterium]